MHSSTALQYSDVAPSFIISKIQKKWKIGMSTGMKEPEFQKTLTHWTDHNLKDYINRDDIFEALTLRGKF